MTFILYSIIKDLYLPSVYTSNRQETRHSLVTFLQQSSSPGASWGGTSSVLQQSSLILLPFVVSQSAQFTGPGGPVNWHTDILLSLVVSSSTRERALESPFPRDFRINPEIILLQCIWLESNVGRRQPSPAACYREYPSRDGYSCNRGSSRNPSSGVLEDTTVVYRIVSVKAGFLSLY